VGDLVSAVGAVLGPVPEDDVLGADGVVLGVDGDNDL
jgi:hypothetical protein